MQQNSGVPDVDAYLADIAALALRGLRAVDPDEKRETLKLLWHQTGRLASVCYEIPKKEAKQQTALRRIRA